jgi:hypothetical protein
MKYKPLALMAATLLAGMLSLGGVQAANVMTSAGAPAPITNTQNPEIQLASHHHWRRWGHHGGSGIFLGFGLSPFYSPYYGNPYYGGYGYGGYGYGYRSYYAPRYYAPVSSSRHVRYCLDRYRTYSPRSNTFIGYDGYRHRCRSPYRY